MNVAIVGSRDYPDLNEVEQLVGLLARDLRIISGGARGVDQMAELAVFHSFGQAAMWRNGLIVADADMVFAFWHGNSKGTYNTIQRAHKKGVPYFVTQGSDAN